MITSAQAKAISTFINKSTHPYTGGTHVAQVGSCYTINSPFNRVTFTLADESDSYAVQVESTDEQDGAEWDAEWEPLATWPAETLAYTAKAMGKLDVRYYLNGMAFYPGAVVATDGHRLHWSGTVAGEAVIIPRDEMALALRLQKKGPVIIETAGDMFRICLACGVEITGKLIDGTYPDVPRVIPSLDRDGYRAITVPAHKPANISKARDIVKAASPKYMGILLAEMAYSEKGDKLPLNIALPDGGEFGVNGGYLADALIANTPATLNYLSASKSILIESGELRAVVMPMRLECAGNNLDKAKEKAAHATQAQETAPQPTEQPQSAEPSEDAPQAPPAEVCRTVPTLAADSVQDAPPITTAAQAQDKPQPVRDVDGFTVGDLVRVSNCQPKPPAHHTQKVKDWQARNFDGVVAHIDTPAFTDRKVGIHRDGRPWLVYMLSPRSTHIEIISKAAAPELPQETHYPQAQDEQPRMAAMSSARAADTVTLAPGAISKGQTADDYKRVALARAEGTPAGKEIVIDWPWPEFDALPAGAARDWLETAGLAEKRRVGNGYGGWDYVLYRTDTTTPATPAPTSAPQPVPVEQEAATTSATQPVEQPQPIAEPSQTAPALIQWPDNIALPEKGSDQARVAAMIKKELAAIGLTAKVKSSSFSMGDSVTAKLQDVPACYMKEIKSHFARYQYGSFNGMEDIYEYTNRRDDIPQTKYLRVETDYTDQARQAAWDWLRANYKLKGIEDAPQDINAPDFHRFRVWDEWASTLIYRVLNDSLFPGDDRSFWTDYPGGNRPTPPKGTPPSGGKPTTRAPAGAPPATSQGQPVASGAKVEKHHNDRKGFDYWLVILPARVSRDEFTALLDQAKAARGWYSRQWGKIPGGFAFKAQEAAEQFAASLATDTLAGEPSAPPPVRATSASQPAGATPSTNNTGKAERLRTLADGLTSKIEGAFSSRLENTPKRIKQAAQARQEGHRLERTQKALYALADLAEAGTTPPELQHLNNKSAVYELMASKGKEIRNGYHGYRLETGEPATDSPAARLLWDLITDNPERRQAEDLRQRINALQFASIPGYFPTPGNVADVLLQHLKLPPSASVLEPSAGSGALCDAIRQAAPTATLRAFEINHSLHGITQDKGHNVEYADFMQATPSPDYDAVVMNPPFENLQDAAHVMHAFQFLKPGGRLVAVMSPAPWFHSTGKAEAFRAWFESVGGSKFDLPEGSFKASGTGVNTCYVVIDKPAAVETLPPSPVVITSESQPVVAPDIPYPGQAIAFGPVNPQFGYVGALIDGFIWCVWVDHEGRPYEYSPSMAHDWPNLAEQARLWGRQPIAPEAVAVLIQQAQATTKDDRNPDLTYRAIDSLFTAFYPETPAGETAWRAIAAKTEGTGKVMTQHVASTVEQLNAAGYTVKEGKAGRTIDDGDLLAMLNDTTSATVH